MTWEWEFSRPEPILRAVLREMGKQFISDIERQMGGAAISDIERQLKQYPILDLQPDTHGVWRYARSCNDETANL